MEITVPALLRIKPNALHKIGKYLRDENFCKIALFYGTGVKDILGGIIQISLEAADIGIVYEGTAEDNEIEAVFRSGIGLPRKLDAIVAVGGGRVIDICKFLAHLNQIPLVSVPTLTSNDGFCSPFSSLIVKGKRRTVKTVIPHCVILDIEIIRNSPEKFLYSGIGDLFCKFTAVYDWKLAFRKTGEVVNDFAAVISRNAADTFYYYPGKDLREFDYLRVIASSLLMSGIAMEIAGSSRPASGSEHLISHAYDQLSKKPSLHGLQVGAASYAVSYLQNGTFEMVKKTIVESGFVDYLSKDKLNKTDFLEAIRLAPSIKDDFYTVLSEKGAIERLVEFVESDELMNRMLD